MFQRARSPVTLLAALCLALPLAARAATAPQTPASPQSPASPPTTTSAQSTTSPAAGSASSRTHGAKHSVAAAHAPVAIAVPAPKDSAAGDMTLHGNQEGTVFRTLTVEGEDRIHFEVERPALRLDLDPAKAPGLDWGSARDVLDRTSPDLTAPLLAGSARETSPYLARPWLGHFTSGPAARFQPNVSGVEQWKLSVVNARGEAVARFEGRGSPPREIDWDGRLTGGGMLMPGATYSYLLEARDRAGNKRNFVGEGFRVSAVRFDGPNGPSLAFTGRELDARAGATPSIVLEAASWLNQWPEAQKGVRVEATARTADEANALASRVTAALAPTLLGDPARIRGVATTTPDAPDGGAVRITPGR